jgi:hypothetical protein
MEDTWTSRDLPVLRAAVQIYEDTGRAMIRAGDIARAPASTKRKLSGRSGRSTPSYILQKEQRRLAAT